MPATVLCYLRCARSAWADTCIAIEDRELGNPGVIRTWLAPPGPSDSLGGPIDIQAHGDVDKQV